MLDFANKTLDQVALTIPPWVVLAQDFGTLMRWDHCLNASIQQIFDEVSRRGASVGDQSLEVEPFQQVLGLRDVVALTCGEAETQWITQAIYRDMDFGREAASAASEGLFPVFFWAPAAHAWARTIVLSIMPCSMSGSSAK